MQADEPIFEFAGSLLANQLVFRAAPPEVDPRNLEKLPRRLAKELDQRLSIWAFRGLGCNPQEEFLKMLVGSGRGATPMRDGQVATEDVQSATACRSNLFSIHKSLNLRGNYLSSQFESREMEGGCRGMKLRNSDET